MQLAPSHIFDAAVATDFFRKLRARADVRIVCEPRHESWFHPAADDALQSMEVARVAADPARVLQAASPGGWRGMNYYRLHGSPKIYYSAYAPKFIANFAGRLKDEDTTKRDVWVIFDNTTLGAATRNALELARAIDA